MQRADANRLALRIARSVLEGARPMEIDVAGTKVNLALESLEPPAWPAQAPTGLTEDEDGPWPGPVQIRCRWPSGGTELQISANVTKKRMVAIRVGLVDHHRELLWTTITSKLEKADDGDVATIEANVAMVKRGEFAERTAGWSRALKDLVAASEIPMVSESRAAAFQVRLPEGELTPAPERVFRRLLRIALMKLDFLDSAHTAKRGVLVKVPPKGAGEPDEEDDQEDHSTRRYWAGGFNWAGESKLEEFTQGNHWQIGWPADSQVAAAKTTWNRFGRVSPGDWFAIKGYGGRHDLVVYYVGEVLEVDPRTGRLTLRPLDTKEKRSKAPRGQGSGNWQDTLVAVEQEAAIEQIFGVGQSAPAPEGTRVDLPPNLILYGPPGTGKTYRLQKDYQRKFRRSTDAAQRKREQLAEFLESLTWFQIAMVALHELGGEASVSEMCAHRHVAAKYAATQAKTHLRSFLWNTLQHHTVATSTTVNLRSRSGEQVFDKKENSRWFFPNGSPPIAQELSAELSRIEAGTEDPESTSADYTFVTFHQSYAYEDFVEGIRPRVDEDSEDGNIGYRLEDGVFKQAVRAAIRLTGFDGSIHAFCQLSREERASKLENAPGYALFIDEINRGNVANIFGELITLLEDDKRLGSENELWVKLPYSKTDFGVPSNLYLIGTMNTADRSVEALDTALRRRFAFDECMPRYDVLDFTISGGIDPGRMLRAINDRIRKLYDRDHAIGHAYLVKLKDEPSLDALKQVFERQILPLLQEYFFGDWGRIGLVLGKDFVRRADANIHFADGQHDEIEALSERPVYELARLEDLTSASFRRIYEQVSDDD